MNLFSSIQTKKTVSFCLSLLKNLSPARNYGTRSQYLQGLTQYGIVFLALLNITIGSGKCMLFIRVLDKDWIQIWIQDSQKDIFRRAG
jgi:hypothetical protein